MTQETTITPELWSAVKDARDDALNRMQAAQEQYERLEALLGQMRDVGMADHLPTIEEVQEAWRRG